LGEAAEILAEHPWPILYDPVRLGANAVPCAAAVYTDDPYVESQFSLEVAERVPNMHLWVTDEHDHDALRVAGTEVLNQLFGLLHHK
jgi:hypothetical protein